MAKIDIKYNEILNKILDEGIDKGDRTGTGTRSIFSHTLEYDMKDGFPLLTTKKMFTKGIITELLWFLNGSTDLRELVEQGNNIWVGDGHKRFQKENVALLYESEATTLLDGYKPSGIKKEDFIDRIINDDEFNKKWGDLGPIYGKQWVAWGEIGKLRMKDKEGNSYYGEYKQINQIQNVIDTLNTNPDSRRIMVSAWNSSDIGEMILPPCHWAFEFYTEELTQEERYNIWFNNNYETGMERYFDESKIPNYDNEYYTPTPKRRLSLKWHQRSVDTPLGLPFNIASYGFLLEMVAQQVNMVPHKLIGDLSNVHIYQNQMDGVKEQLERDTDKYISPTLKLNKAKDIFSYKLEDFTIDGYESYPTIKIPLSN